MSDATADDYAWIEEPSFGITEAYCLSLVRGHTPESLLAALGAEPQNELAGLEALFDASHETWERHNGDRLLVAAVAVGGWTVMVEDNGYIGSFDEFMLPLSTGGGRVVSHFRNVNAVDHFNVWDDGVNRLHFEPLFAFHRDGPDADSVVDEMRAAGFDLRDEEEDPDYELHTAAAWALAERLTGVRVTRELLDTAVFRTGLVAVR